MALFCLIFRPLGLRTSEKENVTMAMSTWKMQTTRWMFRVLGTVAPRVAANTAYTLFSTPHPRRPSQRDMHIMNAAERLQSTYTNGTLAGYAWGDKGNPTVLLVHGWEGHVGNFTSLVEPLVNAGLRVLAFDAPAHGYSTGTTSTMVDYATALSALTIEFGPLHGIVAHSVGAVAAIFMMGTMKHYRIKKLVLVGAPCEFKDVLARYGDELALTQQTQHQMQRLTHQKLGIPLSALSIKALIPYITTPGLLIHDRHDPLIPFGDAETIAAHWQDAELIATEGLGHNKTLRHADVVDRIARFIAAPHPEEIVTEEQVYDY
jgi:pimeloyl-ACP methyl ester carboxylesterase